ncbi:amidase [Burkholderia sp. MSMB617WGS]|uniref:amidase n=1 Tax=Burkholderia TaxID=32008 RepID=UPI00075CB0AA|nr:MULTISPECIES: amidase [Burkholderia]AOJ82807.1 amidase [Burkholderia savannae]AOK50945.1 amidase [Burkholderia sp. MSMB617WGS]
MKRRHFLHSLGALSSAHVVLASAPASATTAGGERGGQSALVSPREERSAAQAVRETLERVARIDRGGPRLNAIIELNPDAEAIAHALDAERAARAVRGPMHGVSVALKDNIATGDRMATTAGSLALDGVRAARDAHLVARLRRAGAVIVAKTNLSEWANFRSTRSTSGWSGRGGLSRNPYALDRTASGSSSGSAAAVAAGLVEMAVGTETDGSIVSPAAINGCVGLKPTVGRVSRDGIVPLSHTQDTAGPIARTVRDAARLLGALAGGDANDPATAGAPPPADYVAALDANALRGARIGIARAFFTGHDEVDAQIERAIARMQRLGAVVIDPVDLPKPDYEDDEKTVLLHEFKHGLPLWLRAFAPHARVRTLADVIAFNAAQRAKEMPYFGQELLLRAQEAGGLDAAAYRDALARCGRRARDEGLARVLRDARLDALVAPTEGTAWLIDLINGDSGTDGFSTPAAVAGFPHLTVPAGLVRGLPVGVSFVGAPWSEARLLALGYAFEQATQWRREPRFVERSNVPAVDA